ncbi:reverse transcriptase domain-containing protein [Tanacetum coccineum]
MHTHAFNSELVEPLPEPERTLNRRLHRQNRRVPYDQRNNPPQHPRIVYPPILNINYFSHFLDILRNYDPMDDEPMWAADRAVAPTLGSAITIPETANEFAIKGNHLTLVKGNQFDGRTKIDPHKQIHEFLRICDMFKYRDTKNEVVRLMMFPLSLTGEAKTWLDELNEGTIETKITQEVLKAAAGGIFLYKTPNQAYQLLKDKVLLKLDWAKNQKTKSSLKKTVAFADEGSSNTETDKIMGRMDAITIKMDAQYKELQSQAKQPTPDLNDDDIPMSRKEEAKFMQTFCKTRFYNDYRDRDSNRDNWCLNIRNDYNRDNYRSNTDDKPYDLQKQFNDFMKSQQSTNAFVKETFMDLKTQLKTVAKNHQASIQNLETKFDRLVDKQSRRPSGSLPSNTQPKPRGSNSKAYQPPQARNEHVNAVSQEVKQLNLRVGTERVISNIDSAMKHSYSNDDTCFSFDVIDEILEEDFDALLDEGSKILHSIEGTLLEEEIFSKFDEFMAMTTDENSESESDTEEPPFKKITINTDYKIRTSLEEPPTDLELKPLPDNLEYVFLEEPSFLPVIISSKLFTQNKSKLVSFLKKHKEAFAWKTTDIPGICPSLCKHKIQLLDDKKPIVQKQRRLNPNMQEVVKKEIVKLLDTGIIYPIVDSPWVSPIHCVPKKGGITVVTNENDELVPTRTVTGWRMPFGLCNAPATFQRCMLAIFHDMIEESVEVFMDDFSVFGDSFDKCLNNLDKMLQRCKDAHLVLNWEKCHFMVKEGIVLGHKVSSAGLEVDKEKINVISKHPPPTNIKGDRIFLGHVGFYRRFIKDFLKIARPLTKLLEKYTPFEFDDECQKAFELLKEKLTRALVIISPNWNLPFELMCDASDFAVGAVLGKKDGKNFHPIYFASKTLNPAQQKYTVTEKELVAVVFAFDKFRSYLILSKTIFYIDHSALKHLFKKQDAKPCLIRWILLLQEFDIEIKDRKGTENVAVGHLYRIENEEISDDSEVDDNFPGETLMEINTENEPWIVDFANYLVADIIPKGMTYQQKNKFFSDLKHYFWK